MHNKGVAMKKLSKDCTKECMEWNENCSGFKYNEIVLLMGVRYKVSDIRMGCNEWQLQLDNRTVYTPASSVEKIKKTT